jgi:AcrR family transcriptional regulator
VNRSSPRTLRDRQREAVTAALLDATEAVIAEKGLQAAGMAEIAKRAGVAVGTLYNYFPDREGLVRALLDTRRAAFAPRIRALMSATTGPFEPRLRAFVRGLLAMFDEHRQFVRIGFEVDPPLAGLRNKTLVETMRGCLRSLLADGGVPEADLDLCVRLLGSAIKAVLLHELERGGPFVADADKLVDVFLRGAVPR